MSSAPGEQAVLQATPEQTLPSGDQVPAPTVPAPAPEPAPPASVPQQPAVVANVPILAAHTPVINQALPLQVPVFANRSLYVGDLHPDVHEAQLFEKFSTIGTVLSTRLCRDAVTRRSLGYAYVNFENPQDAQTALETLNYDLMNGRAIRIMLSQRDPSLRRSGKGNVFIKNLSDQVDTKSLYETFSQIGTVLSCKIATDDQARNLGYGYINFETEDMAQLAIDRVHGLLLDGKQISVQKFVPRDMRGNNSKNFTNLYVKNFADNFDDAKLVALFAPIGKILSSVVMKDPAGKSRGFGFVNYETHEQAEKAIEELDSYKIPNTELLLTVCVAQKKRDRQAEMRRRFERAKVQMQMRNQGVNLYIKHLAPAITETELKENFERFGKITSTKIMRTEQGVSKGFGFVCFEKPEDATKAVVDMSGVTLHGKPIYVALAQRKEDRSVMLNRQYMERMASVQMQNHRMPPNSYMHAPMSQGRAFYMPSGVPQYPQNQQFVQQPPGTYQPQPRWPQGMPEGMYMPRTRRYPMPRAPGNFSGPRHVRNYQRQPRPVLQQPPPDQQIKRPRLEFVHLSTPEQKQYLGNQIYPKVISFLNDTNQGAKVTGMLLEMEVSDILLIAENDALLREKIEQAYNTLTQSQG